MEIAASNVLPFPGSDMQHQRTPYGQPSVPQSEECSHHKLKLMFREAEDAHDLTRKLAFRDEDFYHNFNDDQWTELEKATLYERGQPTYTHNRVKRKVNFLLGMEQRSRTDPKALPRKPRMEEMAEVATDVLTTIEDKTRFDHLASEEFLSLLLSGTEACELVWDQEEGKICADELGYEEFFYDPRSRKRDFSDARYMGYARWRDIEDAEMFYPEQANILEHTMGAGGSDGDYEDRPVQMYASRAAGRKRVRIIVMYYKCKYGTWRLAHFVGGGKLYDEVSPWVDDKGKPRCGIEAQSAYVDRENRRYGVVRDLIGPQQELNHFRAKMWHYANNRRTYGVQGAFDDVDEAKREMAKVDGHVEVNPGFEQGQDWGFIDDGGDVQIFSALLQEAKQEIDIQGPNQGLTGRGASSQSGRSRQIQQDAGVTEENDVFDRHTEWKKRCYQAMWCLAKQFWTEEQYIRVTDEEDGHRFVALNQPAYDEFGRFMGIRNDMAQMDVDIELDAVPDVGVLQQEQFDTLAGLAQSGMPIPPKAIIQASQLRDKKKILEAMEPPEGPDPMQQAALEMEMRGKQADIAKTEAEVMETQADTMKTQQEAEALALKNASGLVS